MKHLLFGLLFIWLTGCTSKESTHHTTGPTKKELIGKYSNSSFMYSYSLILKDSSKYLAIEKSDIFSERTTGTWTIRGQAVRLNPEKKIITDKRGVQEKPITDFKEEAVIIETKNTLVITAMDPYLKLEREKVTTH